MQEAGLIACKILCLFQRIFQRMVSPGIQRSALNIIGAGGRFAAFDRSGQDFGRGRISRRTGLLPGRPACGIGFYFIQPLFRPVTRFAAQAERSKKWK